MTSLFRVWEYGETLACGVREYTATSARRAAKEFAMEGGFDVREVVVMYPDGHQDQITCDHEETGVRTFNNGTCSEPVPVDLDPPNETHLREALRLAVVEIASLRGGGQAESIASEFIARASTPAIVPQVHTEAMNDRPHWHEHIHPCTPRAGTLRAIGFWLAARR